jgi:hypothetical protein
MQNEMDRFQPAEPYQLQCELMSNFGVEAKKKGTKEWIH